MPSRITQPKQLLVEGKSAEVFFEALLNHMALTGVQVQDFTAKDELQYFLTVMRKMPDFLSKLTSQGIVSDPSSEAAEAFQNTWNALLQEMNLMDIQVQDFGGKDELPDFLAAFCSGAEFRSRVTSLGIVRDAEGNAGDTFQSICSALKNANCELKNLNVSVNLPVPNQVIVPVGDYLRVSVLILPDDKTPGMLETICLWSVENNPAMKCIEQYFKCIKQRMSSLPKNMPKAQVQTFLASRPRPGLLLGQAARAGYWPWDSPVFNRVKQFLQAL